MTSIRNIPDEGASGGRTAERLLDAAREAVLTVGWKRTTLSDVARRAEVSRMTVYRTYPDMTTLFGDLMTREWGQVVTTVTARAGADPAADPADQVADVLVGVVAALRKDALLRRVVDVDPELLLPYLIDRRGRSQQAVVDLLAERIAAAQERGARAGEPTRLARSLALATQGFLLSASTMTDDEVSLEDLDAELRELVRRYLA
ncbi:MAG: TetR/AcrR family transcriptional regulator [Nocardioides sp.]|nr:TetR/AcrR family transcriptional regulator [Nocardioides sp.]